MAGRFVAIGYHRLSLGLMIAPKSIDQKRNTDATAHNNISSTSGLSVATHFAAITGALARLAVDALAARIASGR